MKFLQWLENEEGPHIQRLFPFMTDEEPVDSKKIGRYKDRDSYIKAMTRGGKKTEDSTQKIVSATPNSFWSMMREKVENLWNDAIILPPHSFANGQVRPEYHVALALLKSEKPMENGKDRYRLLAYYQGNKGEKLTKNDLGDSIHSVIGGLVVIGGYITHAWVDNHWRGTIPAGGRHFSLYQKLREFARMYLGVHGLAPNDDLTSKSFRASQAKYDYNRFLQQKNA
jgi:hypothetical protein